MKVVAGHLVPNVSPTGLVGGRSRLHLCGGGGRSGASLHRRARGAIKVSKGLVLLTGVDMAQPWDL